MGVFGACAVAINALSEAKPPHLLLSLLSRVYLQAQTSFANCWDY